MAKEQVFEHPPRGHVAILYYDPTNDRYQVVEGDDVDTAIPSAAKAMLASSLAHGYDGALWRKLPLLWGYTGIVGSTTSWTSDGTSPYTLSSAVVPDGEVWVVNSARAMHNNPGALAMWLYAVNPGGSPLIDGSQLAAANDPIGNIQPIILAKDGKVDAVIYGLPATQIVYLHIQGYKMKITM